jgi:hypothetical protein
MQLWVIRATFGVENFDFNTKFVGKSKSLSEVVPKVLVVSKRLGQDLCNQYLLIEGDFPGGSLEVGSSQPHGGRGRAEKNPGKF